MPQKNSELSKKTQQTEKPKKPRAKAPRKQKRPKKVPTAETRQRRMRLVAIILVVGMVGSFGIATLISAFTDNDDPDHNLPSNTTSETEEFAQIMLPKPDMILIPGVSYQAEILTSEGTMRFALDRKQGEPDVNNFVYLAQENFYDDLTFHRILKDFVIQGGDPLGNDPFTAGSGGPGYRYDGSTPAAAAEIEAGAKPEDVQAYKIGSLAMANNGGDPSTNGSQFFIVTGANGTQLPPQYSLFGQLLEGEDTLQAIANVPVGHATAYATEPSYPLSPVTIESVRIFAFNPDGTPREEPTQPPAPTPEADEATDKAAKSTGDR